MYTIQNNTFYNLHDAYTCIQTIDSKNALNSKSKWKVDWVNDSCIFVQFQSHFYNNCKPHIYIYLSWFWPPVCIIYYV